MCRAGPGSIARAWAGLMGAEAPRYVKPGPPRGLGQGSGRVGLKPGLVVGTMYIGDYRLKVMNFRPGRLGADCKSNRERSSVSERTTILHR